MNSVYEFRCSVTKWIEGVFLQRLEFVIGLAIEHRPTGSGEFIRAEPWPWDVVIAVLPTIAGPEPARPAKLAGCQSAACGGGAIPPVFCEETRRLDHADMFLKM